MQNYNRIYPIQFCFIIGHSEDATWVVANAYSTFHIDTPLDFISNSVTKTRNNIILNLIY